MKKQIYTNYKRQNKWLGIIDYKSLVVIIIYGLTILLILKEIRFSFTVSLYIFIILMSPMLALILFNTKTNSAVDILVIIIKYFLKNKIYVNLKYYFNNKKYIYKNNIK